MIEECHVINLLFYALIESSYFAVTRNIIRKMLPSIEE